MKKVLVKLLLITFLIRSMRSQDVTFQEKNNLSRELDEEQDLSDDSEPRSKDERKTLDRAGHAKLNGDNRNKHDEQKSSEQNEQKGKQTGEASKMNNEEKKKSEHKKPNKNPSKDSQSTQTGEHNISEHSGNLKDSRQRKHKPKSDSSNQGKDSTYEKDQKETNNTNKNKTLDVTTNPSPKAEQETVAPLHNKERSSHTFKHIKVIDNDFAYMVAVMKGASYLSAGALIDESWVLTAAATGGINLMRETIRFLRIRLGSINYKKGGTVLPVKYLEIHPYFNSSKPDYDLALIMLSKPVRYTASLRSIRLQLRPKDVTATHFTMTSWPGILKPDTSQSTEVIKHHRILSVSHLHPLDTEECVEDLTEIGVDHDGVMCFTGVEDACVRDAGAPVVINGVLWGILSSWKPEDCDNEDSIFATLVSDKTVSSWIHATVHAHKWHPEKLIKRVE